MDGSPDEDIERLPLWYTGPMPLPHGLPLRKEQGNLIRDGMVEEYVRTEGPNRHLHLVMWGPWRDR
jgi:hypothetical protein